MSELNPCLMTINAGSSSLKFAVYSIGATGERDNSLLRIFEGEFEKIGTQGAILHTKGRTSRDQSPTHVKAATHQDAALLLIELIQKHVKAELLSAIGHRVVQGGPKYSQPERITQAMIAEFGLLCPFDPEHLPGEIAAIEIFRQKFPELPQLACFDTAFHHDLPQIAQILPIPRRFRAKGVRRYGFHGISYSYLMQELESIDGPAMLQKRIVLAHLGNGASLSAVKNGKPVDTSMGFTPTSGVPMGTRSGDLDPGLIWYLARTEGIEPKQFNDLVTFQSGLLGISETSADMRDLLKTESQDFRAAEAIALFCYQIKKCIGAFAAALGGLDTLIFTGGIGENAPSIRQRICVGLEYLGIQVDEQKNLSNYGVISKDGPVSVRVFHTDEELMIAKMVHSHFMLEQKKRKPNR